MRFLSLVIFHLKLYSKNSYFLMTVLSSTTTLILFQYLAAYSQHETVNQVAWLRAGIFGLWASGTTAAGVVGMQKWQGTFVYLINNPLDDYISLVALVMPAALFGLLSFPIAFLLSIFLGFLPVITLIDILFIILLWFGATVLDLCIASVFVLTKNAIIYEELISLPILLLSGLFTVPTLFMPLKQIMQWIIPISMPIGWLLKEEVLTGINLLKCLVSIVIMLGISFYTTHYLIKKAKQFGQFGGSL
ncbi:multidrug ABC transporter permease [Carnobacteriaceae bacterium zg-84]|uniref:multidrug ABC transporter permease n=1 Tax=Granulicatella sp. zg-84 TaxID=2678503 RepID=UPI0013C07207|nr:multidrug ABC transporter permease [Granulicatella sp. zg-84]NEW66957.1 multidrug ABC transporter permease [Granulicatella sp. zg-84]QMI86444.1 multidrug ABC transporter permease [Carnobacteriaceae bacterium zg-84]